MKNQIHNQIRMMQTGNIGITHVYEVLESPTEFHIVQENLEGGNLDEKRINVGGNIDEMRCAEIVQQILQVLSFLHESQIIHRNICPANIMFTSVIDNDYTIKVQGFEFATSFKSAEKKVKKSDLEYNAPEIIRGEVASAKVDIWSLGALAYNIIDGMSPFYDETEDKIK